MTRLMKTLVLTAMCGGIVLKAALPVAAQTLSEMQAEINALKAQIATLQSRMVLPRGDGDEHLPSCMKTAPGAGSVDDIIFEGCNVHVRNGRGQTDSRNSVGNLIIGYNEDNEGDANARNGSHYLVIGPEHTYSRYGGLVAGYSNTVSGRYASVSGGANNRATNHYTSVSGGMYNEASGGAASVSGGLKNTASGLYVSLGGDTTNTDAIAANTGNISTNTDAIATNTNNISSNTSSIATNTSDISTNTSDISTNTGSISTNTSDISTNTSNISTNTSNISTNTSNISINTDDIIFNMDDIEANADDIAAVLPACIHTVAVTDQDVDDVVFSGCNVHVQNGQGDTDSSNGLGNLIIGYNEDDVFIGSTHSTWGANARGGSHNVVIGPEHSYSKYGGLVAGFASTVSGDYASVSGGGSSTASGWGASVSGGTHNKASGRYASVSGGISNTASGDYASVSGGLSRTVKGQYDWRAGGLSQNQ